MKAYKGFAPNPDGTYTEDEAILGKTGMHACLMPIDVFAYYSPASSVCHEVEVDDDAQPDEDGDSQAASRTLTVGAELSITDLVAAQVEYTASRAKPVDGSSTSEYQGAATATGHQGAASATGDHSIAHADGYQSKARGASGCGLTLAERDEDGALIGLAAVIVGREYDGQLIEPDTYYWLHNGKIEVA